MEKVKKSEALLQEAQEKLKTLEAELIVEKTAVTSTENLLKKKDEEIKMAERALRYQSAEVQNLKNANHYHSNIIRATRIWTKAIRARV